ncbi:sas10 c-terminal domain-containing protein, partial [Cystoisospora suis]
MKEEGYSSMSSQEEDKKGISHTPVWLKRLQRKRDCPSFFLYFFRISSSLVSFFLSFFSVSSSLSFLSRSLLRYLMMTPLLCLSVCLSLCLSLSLSLFLFFSFILSDEEDEEEGEEEEEEEEEERERESRTAWGRSAKDFYGAGDDDEEDDDDENSENEETMKMREEEARVIEEEEDVEGLDEEDFGMQQLQEVVKDLQKKKKKKIQHKPTGTEEKSDTTDKTGKEDEDEEEEEDEEDLSLIDGETNTVHSLLSRLSSFSSMIPGTDAILRPRQGDNFVNLPLEDLKRLSKEERERILEESHPELQGLLAQLHTALKTVRRSIKPVLDQVKSRSFMTKEGISFLDVRNQLLCAYVMYLSYYILLKTHGIAVKDHPVIERLVEIRILLEKIRPIENRLQFQMDRLLQLAASQDKTTESEDDE